MRTQPDQIIKNLEQRNGRLDKEDILKQAAEENLLEFFEGLRMCLDKLYTFGIKQVPVKDQDSGQGLNWNNFLELADSLYRRKITGNDARDAVNLAMGVATKSQWNDWYRRILIKDLRCGVSEKTVNKVLKPYKNIPPVPVFECMLAHDGANHESKIQGKKLLEPKLDGVRAVTVLDYESKTVTMYTRNGKVLENFSHITRYLEDNLDNFGRSYVLDGEVISNSFQDLMKQVHRKENVQSQDAKLCLFDIVPLVEFKAGKSIQGQRRRSNMLKTFANIFSDSGCIEIIPQVEVNLDEFLGEVEFKDYNKKMVAKGYEGIMIKDPDAKYECKRSASWLKQKPFIEVSLMVKSVEEGTGRNKGRLGAFVCEGKDDDRAISVNVGSGFSDNQRSEFWYSQNSILGQVVEIRADAITQNQDGTFSLRFPRFMRFRGFSKGEKI